MSIVANQKQSIAGCVIGPLKPADCESLLAWLAGKGTAPGGTDEIHWALGHFDDGVTWARYDQISRTWTSGHTIAPTVSPPIRIETLQELRLFGPEKEVLIWRTGSGLSGRVVSDSEDQQSEDPLAPEDESRVLLGDRSQSAADADFTVVRDVTGARQLLPLRVSDEQLKARRGRLIVRHYFQKDPESGAVRIALTRLVKLQGGQHGG